jgi:hypothetical protein
LGALEVQGKKEHGGRKFENEWKGVGHGVSNGTLELLVMLRPRR